MEYVIIARINNNIHIILPVIIVYTLNGSIINGNAKRYINTILIPINCLMTLLADLAIFDTNDI
jgi:hypothetical protein